MRHPAERSGGRAKMIICHRIGARVGLVGNPSDGFGGKTISSLISDFSASVMLWESPKLDILPHPLFDPMSFASLQDLVTTASFDGYYGGIRLLYATCKRFYEWCSEAGIQLDGGNFSLQYETNIPRQVGLAGSSALVTATLRCLMDFYGLSARDIPLPFQPGLVLSVETEELGIAAGLQDRVVQVYGGAVYMDFSPDYMATLGHGRYVRMDTSLLPPLYLAYAPLPSDSGRIHSTVRYRYEQGDPQVVEGMRRLATLTDEARGALEAQDIEALGRVMNENFDLRRRIYGDECLGATNLKMIDLARDLGLPAKFPGSGGAIVGICPDEDLCARAEWLFAREGFVFRRVRPSESLPAGREQADGMVDRLERLRLAVRGGTAMEGAARFRDATSHRGPSQ